MSSKYIQDWQEILWLEREARLYCIAAGVDPDHYLGGCLDNNGEWTQKLRWHKVAEQLLKFQRMQEAFKQAETDRASEEAHEREIQEVEEQDISAERAESAKLGKAKFGKVKKVKEVSNILSDIVLHGYEGLPCEICGEPLAREHLDEAVCAGNGPEGIKVAHGPCWNSRSTYK